MHGNSTHGLSRSATHVTWLHMKARCYNKSEPGYFRYGGRGITVCARWKNSFANFLVDMGERPSPRHSIDRIDNNKGYSPKNCRWATKSEQARNRRSNAIVTVGGKSKCVAEWCEELGLKVGTVNRRRMKGLSGEAILSKPNRLPEKLRGTYWHSAAKKWMAQIVRNKKVVYLGLFGNRSEAVSAIDEYDKRNGT